MNVKEARQARHLLIRLDRGDELPASLVRALDAAEAHSGFVTGVGSLEAATITLPDQGMRRIEAPTEVVALSGNIARLDGALSIRLSAVLARETDLGLATSGGQLVWARAQSLELHVVVLDDLSLTRTADPNTGLPVLEGRPAPRTVPAPAKSSPTAALEPPSPPPPPVATVAPTPVPANEGPALPQKPQKPVEDFDNYPETGDRVIHFHFGECTVIGSEGDRIRLRQDKDGRVREVALTMLRIEAVDVDGTRLFKLHRKN